MQQTRDLGDLVHDAQGGDQAAWNALVDRFLPLVTAVVRRFRLSPADADDVNQTVWLRLVEHLDEIREPRAVPGWLVTTTRNEALRVIRRRGREVPLDPHGNAMGLLYEVNDMDEGMMRDERSQALRDALLELSPGRRELLDPPARRPSVVLRRDQQPARDPHRQHRPHPRPGSGTATKH